MKDTLKAIGLFIFITICGSLLVCVVLHVGIKIMEMILTFGTMLVSLRG